MPRQSILRSGLQWSAAGVALAATGYAAYVGMTWARYGHARRPDGDEHDALLDRFMPAYDVVDRHHVEIAAPAELALAIPGNMDLFDVPVVRAVFKGRQLILRAALDDRPRPRGLLAEVRSLGWVVLAETPGHEIVLGAVTRPWEANVTFRSVPPEAFAAFNEPDYVKIVWTLRADEVGDAASIFRTETRAAATDRSARAKFRRYWACLSPGIILIRRLMLRQVKLETERHSDVRLISTDRR
jgi:hypothetical protein